MKHTINALITGIIFGIGLIVSGMANPAKVRGFLDLFGAWDPSLALVMGGAVVVGWVVFAWVKKLQAEKGTCYLGTEFCLPTTNAITPRLILGSAAFGIGWGLAGFCPGPAFVGMGLGNGSATIFVVAMLIGMLGFAWLEKSPKT